MAGSNGASGGSGPDYVYSVGVDLTQVNRDLQEWASKTVPSILAGIEPVQLRVASAVAQANVKRFVDNANASLSQVKPVAVTFNLRGASQSLNAFMNNVSRNSSQLAEFESRLTSINALAEKSASSYGLFASGINGVSRSTEAARTGMSSFGAVVAETGGRITKAGTAFDYLQKIATASVFKMVEWGVVVAALDATVQGFKDSLAQAGNVQMEQTLQGLYNLTGAQIDANQALQNATVIARTWGGDIVDIQQAIGLWTKQTHDLAAATILANQGEEMARASGIQTLEVYKDSVAIGAQMGLTYKQLPTIYDQVTRAALRLAEPLRAIKGEAGASQEALKDVFQGLAKASATLGEQMGGSGTDKTAAVIAMVSNQIQAMGDHGKEAASDLSTMFGALAQGGKKRAEWESILGKDAFKDAGSLLDAMKKHIDEIKQAAADGLLGVRPAQVETLNAMGKSLDNILAIYKDLKANSKGMLDAAAIAEMETFQGQSDKLKTSLQALEIEVGTRLLPSFEAWTNYAATSVVPGIEHMVPTLLAASHAAIMLGASWLALQGVSRVTTYVKDLNATLIDNRAATAAAAAEELYAASAGFKSAEAMRELQAEVERETIAVQRAADTHKLLADAWLTMGREANLTSEQLRILTKEEYDAGVAAQQLRDSALKAADGERQLAVAAGEAAEMAGGSTAVSKWQNASEMIGLLAGNATKAIAPLLIMQAVLSGIQAIGDSQDAGSDAALGIRLRQRMRDQQDPHKGFGILQTMPWLNPIGAWNNAVDSVQGIAATVSGHYGDTGGFDPNTNLVPENLSAELVKSPFKNQYLKLQSDYYAPGANRDDIANKLSDLVKAYESQKGVVTETTTEFDSLKKMLAEMQKKASGLNGSMGQADSGHVFANPPTKGGTGGNQAGQAVRDLAAAYNAAAKQAQRFAAADDSTIKTEEALISIYGVSEQSVDKINAAYQDKAKQYNNVAAAGESYIKKLQDEIEKDQAVATSSTATAKQKQQATEAIKQAENELAKIVGITADALEKKKQALADDAEAMQKYWVALQDAKLGVQGLNEALAADEKAISNAKNLGEQHAAILRQQSDAMNLANAKAIEYAEALQKWGPLSPVVIALKKALDDANASLDKSGKELQDNADKVMSLESSMSKLAGSLAKDNFKSIADILAIPSSTLNYYDQMIAGLEQIKTDTDDIVKAKQDLGNLDGPLADQARQEIQYAQQELDLKKQLLPVEQQILSVRSSAAYSA